MKKHFIATTKKLLFDVIDKLGKDPSLFVRHPGKDFTRNRKLDFNTFMKFTLGSSGRSTNKELLDYFNFSANVPSNSAYNQQRSKILPEAFEFIFREFTSKLKTKRLFDGYRLIACDGSNLSIAPNLNDPETRVKCNQFNVIVNRLHLNAFYDVMNRVYVDILAQNWADKNEYLACKKMIIRSKLDEKIILIADRGYENYNIFAHATEKNWNYLIRVKDIGSNGILSGLNLIDNGPLDKDFSITFTRKQTKDTKKRGCKFMPLIKCLITSR
jgi:hypothetical protein